jgi:3-phenylpropionate/trans-cinnamate dioxygenase ferredoxin component
VKVVARLPLADLRPGQLRRVIHPPYDLCVTLLDGRPLAIEDACNHAGASLSEGELRGECVTCPQHGYIFSMKSGALVAPEGLCDDQRRFEARIEGDEVVIEDPFELRIVE